jgi:hypothetical protein
MGSGADRREEAEVQREAPRLIGRVLAECRVLTSSIEHDRPAEARRAVT